MTKFTFKMAFIAVACMLMLPMTACDNKDEKAKDAKPAKEKTEKEANLPNYRYVDTDSLLSKYNLAKDYTEEGLRLQGNFEAAAKRHQNEIQSYATKMENKLRNNGYLSEASYNQDQQTLAGMQTKAQQNMATMQTNLENAIIQGQKAVNDSIDAYIQEYNKKHGYDAILLKNATLYINPALDITDEIVAGLNARYNKVAKK